MLYYGRSYRILLFKHKWKHHYSKHFCISYTGLHFIESQIKSVDASYIPSALNLYLWGVAWCSNQWVRKLQNIKRGRPDTWKYLFTEKKITENCGEVHVLSGSFNRPYLWHTEYYQGTAPREKKKNIQKYQSFGERATLTHGRGTR